MTKPKVKIVHHATYSGNFTLCGLYGKFASRGSTEKLKKNEQWCKRCADLLGPSNEELRKEVNK